MSITDTKKLVLNSEFEEMERLEPFVEELKNWAFFGEQDSSRIMLTLSEAVNNAIVHGNNEDPEKQVIIRTTMNRDNNILEISVEDEGEGFDPDAIPDPLKEENLLNEGGRGVYLIEQYADDIQFSQNGSKVTITFRLADK
jgi:serine/threonine-protein kinase RsbW